MFNPRIMLQAQIGADPRNTLFAYCVRYKEHTKLWLFIVGGAVGAAVLLDMVFIIAVYCERRRRNTQQQSDVNSVHDERPTETSFTGDVGLHGSGGRQPTAVSRPLSTFPDDEPAPTSHWGRRLIRRQNTQSVYPTDEDLISQ